MKNIFALLLPLFLLYAGCKKPECQDIENPACENYDPCYSAFETNAEFIVSDWTRPGDIPLPFRDTIPLVTSIRVDFRVADRNMSRYEWKIGDDPRVFTDTMFFLIFENVSGWVNFSLTTYNDKADSTCFTGDIGKKTLNKAYYFKRYTASTDEEYIAPYPIFGTYLGANEGSPQDTFRVTIHWINIGGGLCIRNLPNGCNGICENSIFNTHYFAAYEPLPPHQDDLLCASPNKIFAELLSDNKTLLIDYEITQNGERIKRKWVGVKL